MKKCEKCQIRLSETESSCPICGSVLTEFDESGNIHTEIPTEAFESAGILDISFTQKLQGVLTRKSLLAAVILLTVCFVYQFIMCLTDISGLLGVLTYGAFATGTAMLYFSAKKESFPKKAKAATMILYITSIVYLCGYSLMMAVIAVCGILMLFSISFPEIFLPLFAGAGMSQEIIGIGIIIGAVLAIPIMLPYYISLLKVTKSLKDGVYGKEITKIKGVGVLRVYSVIMCVCAVYLIMFTLDPTIIFALLPFAALVIIADTLFQFSKVLSLEKFV